MSILYLVYLFLCLFLLRRRTREIILKLACENGHAECLKGAVDKFQSWVKNPDFFIPANLREVAYVYGIKETGK